MSPQRSNRQQLVDGALRCLARLPAERVTARAIADEAGANLASIGYHFGSKDELVTEAVVVGLDRWLAEVAAGLADLGERTPGERTPAEAFRRAGEVVDATRAEHTGLAVHLVVALARAQHDEKVRSLLAAGFRRTRPELAAVLGLGADQAGEDAAGLVLALFNGVLFQALLDPDLAIEGDRMHAAQTSLRTLLPTPGP